MNKLIEFVEKKIQPICGKVANQKYMKAISNTWQSLIPFSSISGLICVLCSPVADYTTMEPGFARTFMRGWAWIDETFGYILWPIYCASISLITLYFIIGLTYNLAKQYKMKTPLPMVVTIASFLIVCTDPETTEVLPEYFGFSGLFSSIFVIILAFEFYRFLVNKKVGYIDIAQFGAPDAIAESIGNVVPVFVVWLVVAVLNFFIVRLTGTIVPELIGLVITPLSRVIDTPLGFAVIMLIVGIGFWFGIHDGYITASMGTLLESNLYANMEAFNAGVPATELPYIVTESFYWNCALSGATCCVFGLGLLCLFSKSKQLKTVGKLGAFPAWFCVGETVLFGTPLVYNPILLIPWCIVSPIEGIIFYYATKLGFVNHTIVNPGWNMPTPFGAAIACMDWRAGVLSLICLLIGMAIYFPFFKAYEKQKLDEEAAALAAEKAE